MKQFVMLISLISVLSLAGCQTNAPTDGAGYELLTPLPKTAVTISREDEVFARQVASHNRQCRKDSGCRK